MRRSRSSLPNDPLVRLCEYWRPKTTHRAKRRYLAGGCFPREGSPRLPCGPLHQADAAMDLCRGFSSIVLVAVIPPLFPVLQPDVVPQPRTRWPSNWPQPHLVLALLPKPHLVLASPISCSPS